MLSLFQVDIGNRFFLSPGRPINTVFPEPGGLGKLLSIVLSFILGVGAFLMAIYLVVGGLRYIFSGGDEKAISAARGQITTAIIGFLVLLLSYIIIKVIEFVTGVDIVRG